MLKLERRPLVRAWTAARVGHKGLAGPTCLMALAVIVGGLGLSWRAQAQAPGAAPAVRLPTLGDATSDDLDLAAERRLGDQVMRVVRRDPDVLDDPQLQRYVQSIWDPLMLAALARGDINADARRTLAWQAFLVRDRAVNAMALPGGYVGVFLGLVATTATKDELAAVMAHEMAHVSQRHIARSMASSQRQTMLGLAAALAGLVAASKGRSADGAHAALVMGQAVAVQGQLNFSREMEREADRVGFGIHNDAAFAPAGMASMFEKLAAAHRLNDSGDYPYLRTHPLTVERIGDARARADASRDMRPATPSIEHDLMRARARVLMDPRAQSLRGWQSAASQAQPAATALERVGMHYAAALASLQLRESTAALAALKQVESAWPALLASLTPTPALDAELRRVRQGLALVSAEALALSGQEGPALALLDATPDARDELKRAWMLQRAAVATAGVRRGGASATSLRPVLLASAESLQAWVTEQREDATAWQHLARASELLGRRLRAVRADAEAQAALGDLMGAMDRLRSGQRMAREDSAAADAIESAVIDTRLRDLMALHKELYPKDQRRL